MTQINSAPTPLVCYPTGSNAPSVMLLESGNGLFALEDGSGVIQLEN